MENIENKKPEKQKIFNFSFNKEEAKAKLRAATNHIMVGVGTISTVIAGYSASVDQDLMALLAAAFGGICFSVGLERIANKSKTRENIQKISETFGVSEQEVEQIFSQSVSQMRAQKATALQQPKPQTKDGGMER